MREQGSDSYDFSHDKIREVAYTAISPIWRRRFHAQVAQALEQLYSAQMHTVIARIAAHYRQAGDTAKAAAYYLQAASEMQFGFAYDETLLHLEHGLAMLRGQPRTGENIALEIAMLVARGRILTGRDGWGSPNTIAAFESARQLCLETNNLAQLVRVQDYLQIAHGENGNVYQDIFDAPDDHAGEMETSLHLAFLPHLVGRTEDGRLLADAGAKAECRLEAVRRGWVSITRPWHLLTTNAGTGTRTPRRPKKAANSWRCWSRALAAFLVELSESELDERFPFY